MIKTYEIDLDDKLVEDAGKIFESLGSDIDSAIKIFLTQAVLRKGFPFEVAVPDEKSEEIKSENLIEENAVEAISESKAENETEPELSQNENAGEKNPPSQNLSDVPDSVKIAELKKDLSELSENPEKLENDANSSSSESEQNSNSEDEDETAPENLFEQWKAQN